MPVDGDQPSEKAGVFNVCSETTSCVFDSLGCWKGKLDIPFPKDSDSLNQQILLFAPLRPQMPPSNAIDHRQIGFPVRTYVWCVALPIVFGAAIYIWFRDSNILVFRLFDALGISLPDRLDPGSLANPIFCSLPDGLWVFAFASWMRLI